MIGPYKFYKSANLYLCYLNNKFKDRKKSNVHLCGFLRRYRFLSGPLISSRDVDLLRNEGQTNPLKKMYSHKI